MRNRRSSLVAGRLLVAIAIGLACSVAAPLSCHAQERSRRVDVPPRLLADAGAPDRDTLRRTDSNRHSPFPQPAPNIAHSGSNFNILAPLGGLILGYLGGTIDHDAGGYRDSFRFAPDKQAHALASVILAKAVADGTSVKVGLATCLLAGAAWEAGQRRHGGFASGWDLSYDALGCTAGALWGRRP